MSNPAGIDNKTDVTKMELSGGYIDNLFGGVSEVDEDKLKIAFQTGVDNGSIGPDLQYETWKTDQLPDMGSMFKDDGLFGAGGALSGGMAFGGSALGLYGTIDNIFGSGKDYRDEAIKGAKLSNKANQQIIDNNNRIKLNQDKFDTGWNSSSVG